MSEVIPLKKVDLYVNKTAIEAVELLLARLRSGESSAMAYVEISRGGIVSTVYSNSEEGCYHHLNSGCARLAQRIASEGDSE